MRISEDVALVTLSHHLLNSNMVIGGMVGGQAIKALKELTGIKTRLQRGRQSADYRHQRGTGSLLNASRQSDTESFPKTPDKRFPLMAVAFMALVPFVG